MLLARFVKGSGLEKFLFQEQEKLSFLLLYPRFASPFIPLRADCVCVTGTLPITFQASRGTVDFSGEHVRSASPGL